MTDTVDYQLEMAWLAHCRPVSATTSNSTQCLPVVDSDKSQRLSACRRTPKKAWLNCQDGANDQGSAGQ